MSGPGMSLDMRVGTRLEQRQVLSLQTIQSLKLLQMATTDLQALVEEQMLENPTLETSTEDPPESPTELEQQERVHEQLQDELHEPATNDGDSLDEAFEFLRRHSEIEDFSTRRAASDNGEPDGKLEAFSNVASAGGQLADHLMQQTRMLEIDELDMPLIEQIIYSLDPRGYLVYPLEDIVKSLDSRYSLEEAEWALGFVQALEPRGVAARSLAECLLLQVGEDDPDYEHLKTLLTVHWEEVLKNRLPQIAKAMKLPLEEVKLLVDLLGTLDPHPGAQYNDEPTQVVAPDVIVEEDDNGEFQVRLTRENLPRLSISPQYLKMLERKSGELDGELDKEALNFVKSKVHNARQLIEALVQRQSTIERVARAIVTRQPEYLRHGMAALKPMKMQDIADELGIHHSTVWRAVSGKYMQTRHGIIPMNSLFTGGLKAAASSESGADVSREAAKLKVKELVDNEDKSKPLSDLAIAEQLRQQGIKASRRVITKYRDELGIPDSRVRRQH
jgi:RNA polymerase sigma-54 factor